MAGCGIGNNSPFPDTYPVAYLATQVVFIAVLRQVILVVPDGVAEGAVLYRELYQIPPIFWLSEVVPVIRYIEAGRFVVKL